MAVFLPIVRRQYPYMPPEKGSADASSARHSMSITRPVPDNAWASRAGPKPAPNMAFHTCRRGDGKAHLRTSHLTTKPYKGAQCE
jgi:hypothetical protein